MGIKTLTKTDRQPREVVLPGCKSFSNRALICAAYAPGVSHLSGISNCEDTMLMIEWLRKVGVKVNLAGELASIKGLGDLPEIANDELFAAKDAGTVMRFGLAFLASGQGRCVLDGSARMRQRPIGSLVDALRSLGANIEYQGKEGFAPLRLQANGLQNHSVNLATHQSSQFASALALARPQQLLDISNYQTLVSRPYLDMTLHVMQSFGAPGTYRATDYQIPGDPNLLFLLAAACALTQGEITIKNLGTDPVSLQLAGIDLLRELGLKVTVHKDVHIRSARLNSGRWNLRATPDLVPALAILCLFMPGTSVIEGISHLRWKESNRLDGFANELKKCGAQIQVFEDRMEIIGNRPLSAACLDVLGDHRLVMSFTLLGLRLPGLRVQNPQVVAKSCPDFFSLFEKALA